MAHERAAARFAQRRISATNSWPQWRFDANRSASAPFDLPAALHLHWARFYTPRAQTWDDPLNNDLMTYDRVFEPVVLDDLLFVGFNDSDKVVALDIESGREVWTFYTDGPVRLPPAAWEGRVYFCSDDGSLYCVKAPDGALLWRRRGGPSDRKALGNRRVVSSWPARGGPVVRDDTVYFAASIWPFLGTFIEALEAETGKPLWVNDGTGPQYLKQPHDVPAFAGVAPQGPLVATDDFLLVPGGRSVPAAFDRASGRLVHFLLDDGGRGNGGSFVAAGATEYFVHTRGRGTRAYELKTGKKGGFTFNEPVITTNRLFAAQDYASIKAAVIEAEKKLIAERQAQNDAEAEVARTLEENDADGYKKATNNLASARRKVERAITALAAAQKTVATNYTGCVIQAVGGDKQVRWELPADGSGDLIRAGRRLYAAGTNALIAIELPATREQRPRLVWSNAVDGRALRLLAARDRLFAVTLQGAILCFGGEAREPAALREECPTLPAPSDLAAKAQALAGETDAHEGYALCFGAGDGRFLEALVQETRLHVVAVDPDAVKVETLRRRFDAAGVYGTRVAVHLGGPRSFQAPPYLANLVILDESMVSRLAEPGLLAAAYSSVRPYGGWLRISGGGRDPALLRRRVQEAGLAQARILDLPDGLAVVREGLLPGAADWTHQYGDVANSLKSDDALVRLPLGLLWFGGPTHMDVLPRHGHGPSPQIVAGRLFIEGIGSLSARDVYTGRTLWKREIEGLDTFGIYFDASYTNAPLSTVNNQKHIPGANARGGNYVATPEAVYVAVSNTCQMFEPRTGRLLRTIPLPLRPGESIAPPWAYLGICGEVLLGGAGFGHYTTRFGLSTNKTVPAVDLSGSLGLVAFDRHSGQMLWRSEARHSFIHNGIAAGDDRVYCLDRLPKSAEDKLKRRGRKPEGAYRITAYDLRTGELAWETATNVFGTWLSYSKRHGVLIQAGAKATDRLKDEAAQGMIAYRGYDGSVLWQKLDLKYEGPCLLHNDLVITSPTAYKTNAGAFGVLDGQPLQVTNPLTGLLEPLRIYRAYGCNHAVACEHLLTFRSGAAGFYDLEGQSGTGNLGGFKSSCSANLIAADGVLNAPDYTRTCSCPYQNQTSLALVHLPDSTQELWTYSQYGAGAKPGQRIRRLGLNFGAPGDRLEKNGTLWLDYPSVGGSSPYVYLSVKGSLTNSFRRHSSQFGGDGPPWVLASGLRGAGNLLIGLETATPPPAAPAPKKKTEDYGDDDEEDGKNGNGKESAGKGTNSLARGTNSLARGTNVLARGTNAVGRLRTPRTNRLDTAYKPSLPPAPYTVRLYFAEPENLWPGERVFDVELQGRPVLKALDIVVAASGFRKGIVKEFRHVTVKDFLSLTLTPFPGSKREPIICGIELVLEEGLARSEGLTAH